MEKRVILAVALSLLVILAWQRFMVDINPPAQSPVTARSEYASQQAMVEQTPQALPASTTESAAAIEENAYVFNNNQLGVTFSNIGGCIKEIALKEYRDSKTDDFYTLMSEERQGQGVGSISAPTLGYDNDISDYSLRHSGNMVEYTALLSGGISITKRYIFKAKDVINLEIEFTNQGSEAKVFDYDITGGSGIEAKESMAARYIQVDAKINDAIVRSRGSRNRAIVTPGNIQWTALQNKYFSLILKPFSPTIAGIVTKPDRNNLAASIRMAHVPVSPGSTVKHAFLLYAGPKITERLGTLGMGFEELINYGIFGGISRVLLATLRLSYKFTHNWGLSIIILAFLMNLILSPLTRKSFKSMKEMQKLQPEIKKLQEKHKKNSKKLNEEIMGLYKEHKVNPLSGCFPLLLQMPMFIALYQGLVRFIELKGASFLWIKDLSMPDSVHLGFLGGREIHVLPLMMAGVMFFQQRFSHPQHQAGLSEQQQQQQRMMGFMMPIMFGFIFYNFQSGLVLYWFTNTLVMTLTQMMMMRKGT